MSLRLSLLCALALASACADARIVAITLTGHRPGIQELSITTSSTSPALQQTRALRDRLDRFDLQVSSDISGALAVQVDALGVSGCALQSGQQTVTLGALSRYDVTIALGPPADSECRLTLTRDGDGGGQVRVLPTGAPPLSLPITDATQRYTPLGDSRDLTLELTPDPGVTFIGWSGACVGQGLRCQLRVERAGTPVSVGLQRQGWCSQDGWCWENPLPQGDSLTRVLAFSPSDVWALGSRSVLRYNGAFWYPQDPGRALALRDLWGRPGEVWGVGDSPVPGSTPMIVRWRGNQRDDNPVPDVARLQRTVLTGVWGGDGTLWVVGCVLGQDFRLLTAKGVIYQLEQGALKDRGGGQDFPCLSRVRGVQRTTGAWDIWAVGYPAQRQGTALRLREGALALLPVRDSSLVTDVWANGEDDVWIATEGGVDQDRRLPGALLRWREDGWQPTPLPQKTQLSAVWFRGLFGTSPDQMWAVGTTQSMLRWDGSAWQEVFAGNEFRQLEGVGGTSAHDLWAVGSTGTILHFDGARFTKASSGDDRALTQVLQVNSGEAWAVGAEGVALHFSGATWQRSKLLPLEGRGSAVALWADLGSVWAMMGDGRIARWDGSAWQEQAGILGPAEQEINIRSAVAIGPGDLWAAGSFGADKGFLFRLRGTEVDYYPLNLPDQSPKLTAELLAGNSRDLWFGAFVESTQSTVLGHLVGRSGKDDSLLLPDFRLTALWMGPPGSEDLYLAGQAQSSMIGKMFRLGKNGSLVGEVAGPNLRIAAITGAGPDAQWAVGSRGLILRRVNGLWRQVESGTSNELLTVHAQTLEQAFAAGVDGQILRFRADRVSRP